MKAITLWQPWASLWVAGVKVHETRSWSTRYRGPLLVHAARRPIDVSEWSGINLAVLIQVAGLTVDALPYGAIVGRVDLVDVLETRDVHPSPADRCAGNWADGRYAWRAERPVVLEPIPYRGRQGLFSVEPRVVSRCRPTWCRLPRVGHPCSYDPVDDWCCFPECRERRPDAACATNAPSAVTATGVSEPRRRGPYDRPRERVRASAGRGADEAAPGELGAEDVLPTRGGDQR